MGYKEIIVQAGSRPADAVRMSLAADLAKRFGAALTAVQVTPPPITAYLGGLEGASFTGNSLSDLMEQQAQEIRRESSQAQAALAGAAGPSGVAATFKTIPGETRSAFIFLTRQADLTVLPTPAETGSNAETPPEAIAMGSGGPVLLIHPEWNPAPIGKRILVAWNGSREAARAVKDAMPLLKGADQVDVLVIDADEATHDVETTLPAYLGRHGCKVQVHRVSSVDQPVGEVMLRQAGRLDSDLIVMGLYGHARLQEMVIGGASRHTLRHARTPLFVSH